MIFTEALAAKIVTGDKTATRRLVNDRPRSPWREPGGMAHDRVWTYPVGKVFTINPGRGVTRIAEAEVTARRIETLSAVTPADARREGFPTRDAFIAAWKAINGGWDPDQRVHVIEFKLHGPDCMGCDGCGWCEGSPAWLCDDCYSTGIEVSAEARALVERVKAEGG